MPVFLLIELFTRGFEAGFLVTVRFLAAGMIFNCPYLFLRLDYFKLKRFLRNRQLLTPTPYKEAAASKASSAWGRHISCCVTGIDVVGIENIWL